MAATAYLLAAAAVTYFFYSLVQSYLSERRFAAFARDHGCEPPVVHAFKLPFGIDNIYRVVRSISAGQDFFDDIILPRIRQVGTHTWAHRAPLMTDVINTAEPANLQALLATQFADYSTGALRKKQFAPVLGHSIFNIEGEEWRKTRALMRPVFVKDNINDLEETERAVRIFLDVVPRGDDGWTQTSDLLPLIYRFTLDTATAFIFGESADSQLAALRPTEDKTPHDLEIEEFVNSVPVIQEWLGMRARFQRFYWLITTQRWRQEAANFKKYASRVVQRTLVKRSELDHKSAVKERYSVVEELTKATQDPDNIRDQVLALIAAGRDSTAGLIAWTINLLAQDPAIFAKLREEVLDSFGSSPTSGRKMDFASLKACKYLQNIISESLRLYPGVPMNVRAAVRDTTLPVGGGPDGSKPIAVRKGQMVGMHIYALHRREDIWGKDAHEFRPERFEGRRSDWAFIPFFGGPRICLGQQYAIIEASYMIARLAQTFDMLEWQGAVGKMEKGVGITLYPKHGSPVRMRYAQ